MHSLARLRVSATIVALALLSASPAVAGAGELTGKMVAYSDLLGGPWTCSLGSSTYSAAYSLGPGNTLHGHLYSKDSSEDEYLGYDAQRKLYWIGSADSDGATESQTSADGVTFVGTLNDGGTNSKATNVYTITSTHKWVVRARGTAGGNPYDVLATCVRT